MPKTEQKNLQNAKEIASLTMLVIFYLLCSFRYFPDRLNDSLVETLIHMLSIAPFTGGLTLVLVTVLQRLAGERLPIDRAVRIFLTLGILVEIFYGLYNYLDLAQAPKAI